MQEMPALGRNPVYIIGGFLFIIFQIPTILAKNLATILIFRFLSGFAGSPALGTSGASLADMYSAHHVAVAIGAWGTSACIPPFAHSSRRIANSPLPRSLIAAFGGLIGPVLGPVIGNFAAQGKDWRWPFLELLWLSSLAFISLIFFLPETFESTILIRRAQRLRKLTGNQLLKAPAELLADHNMPYFRRSGSSSCERFGWRWNRRYWFVTRTWLSSIACSIFGAPFYRDQRLYFCAARSATLTRARL